MTNNCNVPIFHFGAAHRDRKRVRVTCRSDSDKLKFVFTNRSNVITYTYAWLENGTSPNNFGIISPRVWDRQRWKTTASNTRNNNNNINNTMRMSHHESDSWWTTRHTRFIVLGGGGRYVISTVFKTRHGLNKTRHGWRYETVIAMSWPVRTPSKKKNMIIIIAMMRARFPAFHRITLQATSVH